MPGMRCSHVRSGSIEAAPYNNQLLRGASNVGNMQACCLCEGRSDLCFVFASCGFKKWLHDPHFAAVSQTSLYSAHHNLTNSNWLAEVMLKDSVHHHFAHGAASPPSNSLTTMASPRYTLTLVNSLHLGNVAITRTVFWLFWIGHTRYVHSRYAHSV